MSKCVAVRQWKLLNQVILDDLGKGGSGNAFSCTEIGDSYVRNIPK